MANASANQAAGLPRTIEGSTSRYLTNYEKHFKGQESELKRLKAYAEAKILRIRQKAPTFYEEKLPKLVNQAASALLACDTSTKNGLTKFHESHKNFLLVLDTLMKTQPAGEVDFQIERERVLERELYLKKYWQIREQIDRLEAMEFVTDEIGEDAIETNYSRTMGKIDALKDELKCLAIVIANMEGEKIEEETKFELIVPQRSTLERLSAEQLKNLESQMIEFLKKHNQKRKAIYVNKTIIDEMISNLNIDATKFKKEELNDLSKDALDAYKSYFRNIESKRRDEYFDTLINDEHLKPKEGRILTDPDDVPEEIKQEFIQSKKRQERRLDEVMEEFARRPEGEEDLARSDLIEDDDDNIPSEDDEVAAIEKEVMKENSHLFNRVKEEPRDDYDDESSEDEIILEENVTDDFETMFANTRRVKRECPDDDEEDEDEYGECEDGNDGESSSNGQLENDDSKSNGLKTPQTNGHDNHEEGEDFEMLGVVEPTDKVEVIELD